MNTITMKDSGGWFRRRALVALVWVLGANGWAADSSSPPLMAPGQVAAQSLLLLNQQINEGYYFADLDLNDVDAVFGHVFARLPAEVTIYPSENYYYFVLYVQGRQIWGNIRLPAGRRERGVLSFGYSEFNEFPSSPGEYLSRSKYFTDADGLLIKARDPLTFEVRYSGRMVVFHLHR
ncbi:MAG TPA: hypothetical protein P5055_18965, partial [Candidatus Paceibacterota bacterium]|nr:hypothetical protein [Candidatus Paceibacterota bacterium]